MSLVSYRKRLEEQRLMYEGVASLPRRRSHKKDKKRKSSGIRTGFLIFGAVFLTLLLLAAFKNPSQAQAKSEVKSYIIDSVNKYMRENLLDKEQSNGGLIGSAIAMVLMPMMIDKMVQTDVDDWLLFSTFDASMTFEGETKNLMGALSYLEK